MVSVPYASKKFPKGTVANGSGILTVSWDEILWSALTVGRPGLAQVFQHGAASWHEAVFRLSMIRMALQQTSPTSTRLRKTNAFKALDPTEKGAVNYFLGMTVCKLFAARLLDTPWLLHLDVFKSTLLPVLKGKGRPDLVGQEAGGGAWHAFESKGRMKAPPANVKKAAKKQAKRLKKVNGKKCRLHVGAVTYFSGDTLNFFWRDPKPARGNPIEVSVRGDDWQHYYSPVVKLYSAARDGQAEKVVSDTVYVEEADLSIGFHASVSSALLAGRWEEARTAATEVTGLLKTEGFMPDGIKVIAGDTWAKPFDVHQQ